jgi:hypothetical protein
MALGFKSKNLFSELSRNHAEEIENWRSTVGLGTLLV